MGAFDGVFILESLQDAWEELMNLLGGVDSTADRVKETLDWDVKPTLTAVDRHTGEEIPGKIDSVTRKVDSKFTETKQSVDRVDIRTFNVLQTTTTEVLPTITQVEAEVNRYLPGIQQDADSILREVTHSIVPEVRTIKTTVREEMSPRIETFIVQTETNFDTTTKSIDDAKDDILGAFDGAQLLIDGAIRGIFGPYYPLIEPVVGDLPGTLLDLQDPANIFSAALIKDLAANVFSPLTEGPTATMKDLPKSAEETAKRFTTARSPKTPEQAKEEWEAFAPQADASWTTASTSIIIAEAASLGQLDYSLSSVLQGPRFSSMIQTAKAAHAVEHEAALLTPLRYYYQAQHVPIVPGPQDLIRFLVKEVISTTDFDTFMAYHGFQSKWKSAYWDAHWRDLAAEQIQDAYHRGTISKDERDHYLVLIDYKPDPRPGISVSDLTVIGSLAKRLIPRVDLRYGWEMGEITFDDLVQRYQWLGYEDDSELMASIQVSRALTAEVGQVRSAAISNYTAGFTTEDTLRASLTELGYSPSVVEYYVEAATARRQTAQMKALLDVYEDSYIKEIIDEEELKMRVGEILVEPEAIDFFLDRAYVRKHRRPPPPKTETLDQAAKDTQKYRVSRAIQLYRRYTVEKDELESMFIDAGLDPGVAAAKADYEQARRPVAKPSPEEITREKEALRRTKLNEAAEIESFRKKVITAAELQSRLEGLGYTPALANAITQLEVLRAMPKPTPPKTEVVRLAPISYLKSAYHADLLTGEAFYDELIRRGYSEDSATLVLEVEAEKAEAALLEEMEKMKPPEPEELQEAPLTYVKAAYHAGYIDELGLQNELLRRGYSDEAATLMVTIERDKKLEREAKEAAAG